MKILKASAGSGKTYNLSHEYIDMLRKDPLAYRHILAVTFTNKATAEMKARILKDLNEMPDSETNAKAALVNILHDYSAFSISTIDKFFQRTLKSFSREIGQFADYQIELDRQSLIDEAMDRILDSLTEDKKDLLKWMRESLSNELSKGVKFSIDERLHEMGKLLKSEEHRTLAEEYKIDDLTAYGKDRLYQLRKNCRAVIDGFTSKVKSFGIEVKPGVRITFDNKKTLLKSNYELRALYDESYSFYCTALILDKLIFSLGLAGEFYKEFDALLKEKNVMCLDESNTILRDIISGSDAPFIYEKLGVRYEHFLLDEFQDTSNIQWENFRPLLKESEGNGNFNLIVGDIKQCIYRFRDSEWELLGSKILEDFPSAEVKPLDGNWRSTKMVVNFNNDFFSFASKRMGLEDIYTDVCQKAMIGKSEPQKGYVRCTFAENEIEVVLESIAAARSQGAEWKDIAVLVRNKKEGSQIASELISKDIPVVSDDSLRLKTSLTARRIIALLQSYDNPDDSISRFCADQMNVTYPQSCHSLVDFCEELLRSLKAYDPATFEGETLFVQAFMDEIQNWTSINGNNLKYFLKHWDEADPVIGSPANSESVRVITIHKSKGLEFPYVIFPFAEKVDTYKHGEHWCHLDASKPLGEESEGIYPVDLTKKTAGTPFEKAYDNEEYLQRVDNMNVFYVALTRAGKCLHIISDFPPKTLVKAVENNNVGDGYYYSNFSQILFHYLGGEFDVEFGEPYDFTKMKRSASQPVLDFLASYPSIPLAGRLAPSADAMDFFGEDGTVGAAASHRLRGIVLHGILSEVEVPDDLDAAVRASVSDGQLSEEEGKEALELLRTRIASHGDWFPEGGAKILNETPIIGADGRENRPDRVISTPEGVIIVDFKFGNEDDQKYLRQVRRYADLYRSLGYKVLSGAVWYVVEDNCIYI